MQRVRYLGVHVALDGHPDDDLGDRGLVAQLDEKGHRSLRTAGTDDPGAGL
ncbi:hypothetical protein HCJ76_42595 [Streptomyces sp. MC1]|uniref:hypothetical protein n=1 Tax=Streptomyces sp. MC1 TaxID=295105 RepID=UPI0018CA918A|nr:hypothetical protein [Streptomyces sp. MC1]MBG7704606.1 hypothetical protein [Streptomyces sp. MC1]